MAKKQFEEIIEERNEEIASIKESVETTVKELIEKGEKAAFLTRDLIIKVNLMQKIVREEKKLSNPRLVGQSIKELAALTDKIYENIKAFDVNGKLATIDL